MTRYSVVFKEHEIRRAEAAEALNCSPEDFSCSEDLFKSERCDVEASLVLFEEAGVCFAELSAEILERLRRHSSIVDVRPVYSVTHDKDENATEFLAREGAANLAATQPFPWHIEKISAHRCWETSTGRGVKVGIIDSEIDNQHPDLPIVEGMTFHPETDNWFDGSDNHGTFCAGIVGARNNNVGIVGVAPECDLYALRVNKYGRGDSDYIFCAMMWALQKGLDVVSISQWSASVDPYELPWSELQRGAQILNKAGCSVVGISGNSGSYPNHWVSNPGRCPNFIAVGGTERNDIWWSRSSYGPSDLAPEMAVELVAPSSNISSIVRGGGIGRGSGTSYACPQVSGLIALLKEIHPDWTPDDLLQHIKATATDLGPKGLDPKYGIGRIDSYAAVVGRYV